MAIKERKRKSDGGISFTVHWVVGGGRNGSGPSASETFGNRGRAEQFERDVKAAGYQWPEGWVKGKGYVTEQAPTVPSLDEVRARFMDAERDKIVLNTKRAKQVGKDASIYRLHIQPTFGSLPVTSITRQMVRDWVVRMTGQGAAASTVKNRHNVLSCVLGYAALELGLRPDNPARGVPMPKADDTRDIRFFGHGEWAVLRRCFRSDVHDLIDAALSTAARWQEVTAIRVGDLSWSTADEQVLHIHLKRSWAQRDENYDNDEINWAAYENRKWKLQGLKNRSNRWVSVQGDLARRLWESVAARGQDEYVFVTANGNPWRYDDFHTDRWAPAVALAKQHGLTKHATFHMLRHTAVVWSLADGEDIYKVSAMLGHASIQITYDTYGGLLNLKDSSMAKAMARQLVFADTAILPVNLRQEDVDAAKIRPGARGESRRRLRAAG